MAKFLIKHGEEFLLLHLNVQSCLKELTVTNFTFLFFYHLNILNRYFIWTFSVYVHMYVCVCLPLFLSHTHTHYSPHFVRTVFDKNIALVSKTEHTHQKRKKKTLHEETAHWTTLPRQIYTSLWWGLVFIFIFVICRIDFHWANIL